MLRKRRNSMPTSLHHEAEADRVRCHTPPEMLRKTDEQIERNISYYAAQKDDGIAYRIEALRREWSINRYLQVHTAAVGFIGAALGLAVSRKWAVITAAAFGFLL